MQGIFNVTFPFFALVLCGWAAARSRWLPDTAIPGLNGFVLYFALPCLLFRFGAGTPVRELLDPWVLLVYAGCALAIVGFTVAVTLSARVQMKDAAFGALVAAFPNAGFMGVPLLVAMLGNAAAGPVIACVLTDIVLTSSLCIALAQGAGAGAGAGAGSRRQGRRVALAKALRGAAGNPLPWAIGLGAAGSISGLALPAPVATVVGMLADAASPVALFTIGAVLWVSGQHAARRTRLADYLPVAAIKLALHPLLVLAVGTAAIALGAPLTGFQLTVLTLVAALPSASNVSVLAERHGADNGRIARIIMSSTVLAFGSFSLAAWAFGVRPGGATAG